MQNAQGLNCWLFWAASEAVPTVSLEGAPGVSELLSRDETGFFSRRTPAAYATLLAELAADVPRRRRVGLAARRCVVRTEDTTRRVIEIYREVRERFRVEPATGRRVDSPREP